MTLVSVVAGLPAVAVALVDPDLDDHRRRLGGRSVHAPAGQVDVASGAGRPPSVAPVPRRRRSERRRRAGATTGCTSPATRCSPSANDAADIVARARDGAGVGSLRHRRGGVGPRGVPSRPPRPCRTRPSGASARLVPRHPRRRLHLGGRRRGAPARPRRAPTLRNSYRGRRGLRHGTASAPNLERRRLLAGLLVDDGWELPPATHAVQH